MKNIIIKPMITEKSEKNSEDHNQYTFMVDKKANKIEIKKAVEDMFNVQVTSVNTLIMPRKEKSRHTRKGVQRGSRAAFKKAIVRVVDGDFIDYYSEQ